jgi:hypothetical protein
MNTPEVWNRKRKKKRPLAGASGQRYYHWRGDAQIISKTGVFRNYLLPSWPEDLAGQPAS